MTQVRYNNNINVLRAFAILLVLLFHLKIDLFSGGFVGVDIFFVISGYLISTKLKNEFEKNNKINYANYFNKRFIKIVPPLIFVILSSFLISIFLLPPNLLLDFAKTGIFSLISIPDIYFFYNSNYFDNESYLRPLLHLWSLGFEIKFYILMPLIFIILNKLKNKIFFLLFLIIFVSFINFYYRSEDLYFFFPLRLNEFLLGILIAFYNKNLIIKKSYLNEILIIVGFTLILFASMNLNSESNFPSYNWIFPSLGVSMLLIASLRKNIILETLSSLNFISIIGKASYSIYLIHWPIIVFYSFLILNEDYSVNEILGLALFSIIFGILSYKFIENYFIQLQFYLGFIKYYAIIFFLFISILIILLITIFLQGLTYRLDNSYIDLNLSNFEEMRFKRDNLMKDSFSNFSNEKNNILIIGDSYSGDIYRSLVLNNDFISEFEVRNYQMSNACLYKFNNDINQKIDFINERLDCEKKFNTLINSKVYKESSIILMSFKWGHKLPSGKMFFSVNQIPSITDYLKQDNKKIILMTKRTEFYNVPALIMKYNNMSLINFNTNLDNFNVMNKKKSNHITKLNKNISIEEYLFLNRPYKNNTNKINKKIQDYSIMSKVPYFGLSEMQCKVLEKKCIITDNNKNIIYLDHGHLTVDGSILFSNTLRQKIIKNLK